MTLKQIPLEFDRSFWIVYLGVPLASMIADLSVLSGFMTLVILTFVFLLVTLHEYGHCWAAIRKGYSIDRIRLWYLGGVASIKGLELATPKEEIYISLAGPIVNILLALPAIPLIALEIEPISILASYWFAINALLGMFNLLPAFPLDGGRVLRAVLTFSMPHYHATILVAKIGIGMALLIGISGLFVGAFMMPIIAIFIIMACYQTLQGNEMRI